MNVPSDLSERVLDLAMQIQQVAAPTFFEQARAAFVRQRFGEEGLDPLLLDEAGNVLACLKGRGQQPPLIVSAHLDTVFPLETDLRLRRAGEEIHGPGIGDNSLGVAGLFGLLWGLKAAGPLPGDLWLAANVGEEGLGNLCGMRALVQRFGSEVSAYLVLEGMSLGQVYHRGLGVERYRISVRTPGGHSWVDYGKPSAIHELARLVNRLTALELPLQPRTTLNVGVISGGTTVNTIAAQAQIEVDLRSEGARALENLAFRVQQAAQATPLAQGAVEVQCELIGKRPAGKILAGSWLVRLAQRCLRAQGIEPHLSIGSTDANIPLSLGYPAVCIGLTRGAGAHTPSESIQTRPLEQGLGQLLLLVEGIFQANA